MNPSLVLRAMAYTAIAMFALASLWATGNRYDGWDLVLHEIHLPHPSVLRFNAVYAMLGTIAALALLLGFGPLVARAQRSSSLADAVSGTPYVVGAMAVAFVAPLLVRTYVLHGMPLADDERVYELAARILASGRLVASSHPMPAFFDHHFVINDGRLFTQYFLGWPALLAPWTALGLGAVANPFYAATTVPALYLVARRLTTEPWARVAVGLHVASPFWILLSAGTLSHTSCMAALAWTLWAALRSHDDDAPPWIDGFLAVAFCIAFFIRPLTAVLLGAPLLGWWLLGAWRQPARLAAFILPAALGAGCFLAVNVAQHGDPLQTGYSAYWEFLEDVDFRNNRAWARRRRGDGFLPNLRLSADSARLRIVATAYYRMSFAWLGTPVLLLVGLAAPLRDKGALVWSMVLCMTLGSLAVADVGIDTVGPVHFAELSLPLLLLTVGGLHRMQRALAPVPDSATWLGTAVVTLVVVAWIAWVPVRWGNVAEVARALERPHQAIESAGLPPGTVVFYRRGFARQCPDAHFVYNGPINALDFDDPVIYALDRGHEANGQLMARHFADRRPYKLVFQDKGCRYRVLPGY